MVWGWGWGVRWQNSLGSGLHSCPVVGTKPSLFSHFPRGTKHCWNRSAKWIWERYMLDNSQNRIIIFLKRYSALCIRAIKMFITFDPTILLLGITIDVICKNLTYRDTLFYCTLPYCTLQILLFFTNWGDQSNDNIAEAWVWRSNSQGAVNHSRINTSCLRSNQTSH